MNYLKKWAKALLFSKKKSSKKEEKIVVEDWLEILEVGKFKGLKIVSEKYNNNEISITMKYDKYEE